MLHRQRRNAFEDIFGAPFISEALENPEAFYDAVGDQAKYRKHLKLMMESCNAFLSIEKVDSHPMSEYRFY